MLSFEKLIKKVELRYGVDAAARLTRAIAGHQLKISERALRAAITAGNVAKIEAAMKPALLQRAMAQALKDPLAKAAIAAGEGSAQTFLAHGISMTFDAKQADVVAFARTHAAEAVVGVAKDTRAIIAEVVARGAERGLTVVEQARAIREVVGLPPNWAKAPAKLGDELRAGQVSSATSRRMSAVQKAKIKKAIRTDTVTEKFIKEMQQEYRDSLINRRALTIARTESSRAAHYGLNEQWKQGIKSGALPDSTRKWWVVTPDERLSMEHARIPGMNPKGRKISEGFMTTEGVHMYPPSRPNCRCTTALAFGGQKPYQHKPKKGK